MTTLGLKRLAQHMPGWHASRSWFLGLTALISFSAATMLMLVIDRLWPQWTVLGQIALIPAGFVIAGQFYWRRKSYLARWGDRAYQRALSRHIVIGLPLIFAALAHTAYLPGQRIVTGRVALILSLMAGYLMILALVLWARSVRACGLDTLLLLYVYFPDEGRLVESAIYRLIRHPVYAALIRVTLALGLWRGTLFSILFGLFMPIGMTLWLRFVEEPELIERFGDGYRTYRQQTPAFWPRPRTMGSFFRYLLTGL